MMEEGEELGHCGGRAGDGRTLADVEDAGRVEGGNVRAGREEG